MKSISYDDFCFYEGCLFEMSKRNLLERVIYLSIGYFTIATEMRFLEMDKYQSKDTELLMNSIGFK